MERGYGLTMKDHVRRVQGIHIYLSYKSDFSVMLPILQRCASFKKSYLSFPCYQMSWNTVFCVQINICSVLSVWNVQLPSYYFNWQASNFFKFPWLFFYAQSLFFSVSLKLFIHVFPVLLLFFCSHSLYSILAVQFPFFEAQLTNLHYPADWEFSWLELTVQLTCQYFQPNLSWPSNWLDPRVQLTCPYCSGEFFSLLYCFGLSVQLSTWPVCFSQVLLFGLLTCQLQYS